MVFSTAVRLLGDPSEAEDIAQIVFLRAYERFDSLQSSPSAGGWLRTVATNLCLNHLKRFRARFELFSQSRNADRSEFSPFAGAVVDTDSPAERFERGERRARLERALRLLPAAQRIPLVLFHFQQHGYRDIATLLGVSLSKVKTDIHRGRESLRSLMEDGDDSR